MKTLLMILIVLLPMGTWAQPLLTGSNSNPVANEQFFIQEFNAEGFDPGDHGPALTWDYSTLTPVFADNYLVIPAYASTYGASFPSATVALKRASNDQYHYYRANATEYGYMGYIHPGVTDVIFDNRQVNLTYPFGFLDTQTDDYSAHFTYIANWKREGEIYTWADAYGTLITPTGTFTDVLRLKIEEDYIDTTFAFGLHHEGVVHRTTYAWMKPGYHYPILLYYSTMRDGQVTYFGSYLEDVLISNDPILTDGDEVKVFPTVTDIGTPVQVRGGSHAELIGRLVDMNGAEISRKQGTGALELPTSGLSAGMYFVEIEQNGIRTVRKLILR